MRTKNIFIALVLMVAAVLLSVPMATAQNLTPKVHPKSGLYGYWGIKKNGNEAFIIKPKFDRAERFVNGHAFVSVNGAWYVIGNDGKALLSTTYSKASALSNDHYCVRQGDKYGVVDLRSLAEILPIKYDAINTFDGKYRLTINGKHGLADKSGMEILPIMYDAIRTLGNAYEVAIGDKFGIVDKTNKIIVEPQYKAVESVDGGLYALFSDKWIFVDSSGEVVDISDRVMHYTTNNGQRLTKYPSRQNLFCDGVGVLVFTYVPTSIEVYAFRDYSSLTSITIPDSVTSIGNAAFYNCNNLTSITIPDSVTEVGYFAFDGCYALKDVNVNITDLAKYCTNEAIHKIPGNKHFYIDNKEIAELTIPDSVTEIGERAFYGCSSLISVTIPDSVTEIGGWAFYGCYIEEITAERWIGYAFNHFAGLKRINGKEIITDGGLKILGDMLVWVDGDASSVSIPASVKSIASSAFVDCRGIKEVNVVDLNLWLRSGVNMSSSDGWSLYHNGKLVTNVTIPNGVTKIADGQFCNNKSLTSITIPNSVTKIGYKAFYKCSRLGSITIPASVKEIGGDAFGPNYNGFLSIYMQGATPPKLLGTFENNIKYYSDWQAKWWIANFGVYVPERALFDYRSADVWNQMADKIKPRY